MYVNDLWLALTNYGIIGAGRRWSMLGPEVSIPRPRDDLKTMGIWWVPSLEFPPRTENDYLYWSWVYFACLRGADTVMVNFEPMTKLIESSTSPRQRVYDRNARADQQYYWAASDTSWWSRQAINYFTYERYHPVGLDMHTTAYAWSVEFAKRFIIFDNWFVNVSDRPIYGGAAGYYVDPFTINDGLWLPIDHAVRDITGNLETAPGMLEGTIDTLNIAWWADNDGDPLSGRYTRQCPTGVIGVRVLRTPMGGRQSSNWWMTLAYSETGRVTWGPTKVINGLPSNMLAGNGEYRLMINGEMDYDQLHMAINYESDGWRPPLADLGMAKAMAGGAYPEMTIGAGPFDPIAPGDSVPFTFALVAGEGFHSDPRNFNLYFDPLDPAKFASKLDFSDLVLNARWADWFYDVPGYDTDGDGNRGKAYLVNCDANGCDSVFYKGDGIPDFSGPKPPNPPPFTLTSKPSKVILRWDGAIPETEFDVMSGKRDFEGYRVYAGKFTDDDDLSLIASWDLDDYERRVYNPVKEDWETTTFPMSTDEWKEIVSDDYFDPRNYSVADLALAFVDSTYDTIINTVGQMWIIAHARHSYWEPNDDNRHNEYFDTGVPGTNMIQRVGERDTLIGSEIVTYGVYEFSIDNLNPSVPMYFAVSAFDFGNYQVRLHSLESSPSNNVQYGEPIYSSDVVVDSNLKVSVFPNPYKIQYTDVHGNPTSYYLEGYEGRGVHKFVEQDRRIHFINLPETATIRIFSLDGDLIREIHHPDPYLTTYSSSVGWDLISRNTQAVVSGIYIWRVDSRLGTQVGKLVIIK